jgi:4-aminobutyrate aminotransferase-like enzyme
MSKESPKLEGEKLHSDPRIAQAKQLLIDTVKDHTKKLTGIKPADPSLLTHYNEELARFAEYRGAKLWFPYLGSGIGNGPLVELLDGSVKYDFISGIGPHYLGHSHPQMISACIEAAINDTVMQGHLQQNAEVLTLTETLCEAAGMDHCFLTSSGAMANENALKIAFQKRFPAYRVLSFEHAFAGRTLALAQITDKPSFRDGLPSTIAVDYIPFFNSEKPEESTKEAVRVLKQHLERHPKEYALMCFELVQGEAGFNTGTKEFFTALMQILRENNISIFIDEVQTFGRLPALFGFQYFGLEEFADIVSIGKLSQVCATLFNNAHAPRPGLLSQTFISSTSAIHAAITLLNELLQGNYYGPNGKIVQLHNYFVDKLKAIAKRHPGLLHGPFGIGAMIAFTPFEGNSHKTNQCVHALFEAGLISFVAGSNPTRIRFLMPVGVVTTRDIDEVAKIIEETLTKVA